MKRLINELKENNQDFEFYPTTKEIIQVIANDIRSDEHHLWHKTKPFLDIGCGNGNFFKLLDECLENGYDKYDQPLNSNIYFKKYGIEKSSILVQNLPEDIVIVGTDFINNTLIDKNMTYIFCNPPYSEFEFWTEKIIKECNCEYLYLVIPERWKNNKNILKLIDDRCWISIHDDSKEKYKILDSFSFENSEYRQARAKIDIIKLKFKNNNGSFDIWFNENFNIFDKPKDTKDKQVKFNSIKNELVVGQNLIERLVELYQNEMEILLSNYRKLESIDNDLLDELGVNLENLKNGLKLKISGLKNKYWKELFDNLDKITNRLTSKYRKRILDKMFENVSIDITADNMYSIVIWIIKHANIYQDEQVKDIYYSFTELDNVKMYKSNQHFVKDTWRYGFKNSIEKYYLEYRLVLKGRAGISSYSFENHNGISKTGYDFIQDIFTIGKIFGFDVDFEELRDYEWSFGKSKIFYDKEGEIFGEFRSYKNGNLHVKFNQKFIKKLNIEAGKLNGWLKDPENIVDEIEDVTLEESKEFFKSSFKIESKNINNLIEYKE